MRAISCAIISFVSYYIARHWDSNKNTVVNGLFGLMSFIFLGVSIVLMILGM